MRDLIFPIACGVAGLIVGLIAGYHLGRIRAAKALEKKFDILEKAQDAFDQKQIEWEQEKARRASKQQGSGI